ncbi:MAG: hypothetical protein HQM11_06125 [SAR324 cluster bacterium]|nr:hypothetical protein [SAR324 cluster bacterium]
MKVTIIKYVVVICLLAGISAGCESSGNPLIYQGYNKQISVDLDLLCKRLAVTHFLVENRQIVLRSRKNGEPQPVNHYYSRLPDGYYFCSEQQKISKYE